MAEARKMVAGFNHNVKHRGRVYHVQTEDSGQVNPHIITHLFVGGNILASKKTSYADIAGAENLPQVVRELMEEQHKEMLRNLINGVYDQAASASDRQADHYQPGELGGDAEGAPVARAPGAAAPAGAPPAGRPAPAAGPGALPRTPIPRPLPAAAPLGARPLPGETVIGEDLISEKTLDEVILSYLAEDLDKK